MEDGEIIDDCRSCAIVNRSTEGRKYEHACSGVKHYIRSACQSDQEPGQSGSDKRENHGDDVRQCFSRKTRKRVQRSRSIENGHETHSCRDQYHGLDSSDQRPISRRICKFYREGYCKHGSNCPYSHDAEDSDRRPEVCKFYKNGACKKGYNCVFLHGESPCKAFYKGECSVIPCYFSHAPLTDYTKGVLEQMLIDEKFAMRERELTEGCRKQRKYLFGITPFEQNAYRSYAVFKGIPRMIDCDRSTTILDFDCNQSSVSQNGITIQTSSFSPLYSFGSEPSNNQSPDFDPTTKDILNVVPRSNPANIVTKSNQFQPPSSFSGDNVQGSSQNSECANTDLKEKERDDFETNVIMNYLRHFRCSGNNCIEDKRRTNVQIMADANAYNEISESNHESDGRIFDARNDSAMWKLNSEQYLLCKDNQNSKILDQRSTVVGCVPWKLIPIDREPNGLIAITADSVNKWKNQHGRLHVTIRAKNSAFYHPIEFVLISHNHNDYLK